ncbi:unnamed protein product [Urochloa humidicola]
MQSNSSPDFMALPLERTSLSGNFASSAIEVASLMVESTMAGPSRPLITHSSHLPSCCSCQVDDLRFRRRFV